MGKFIELTKNRGIKNLGRGHHSEPADLAVVKNQFELFSCIISLFTFTYLGGCLIWLAGVMFQAFARGIKGHCD